MAHGGNRNNAGRKPKDRTKYLINIENKHKKLLASYSKKKQLSNFINELIDDFVENN